MAHRRREQATSGASREALAGLLSTLGSPVRLAILDALRRPVPVGQIEVRVAEPERGPDAERTLSRQAVSWHLEQLLNVGLVRRLPGDGRSHRYVLDPQRLFAVVDELHELTRFRLLASSTDDSSGTVGLDRAGGFGELDGARLVLVYGREDGTVFPLAEGTRWTVGRDPGCELCLDYDASASDEHAAIERDGDGYRLVDLGSSNGTWVNGRRVPPGQPRELGPGDILRVGRSKLVFQS